MLVIRFARRGRKGSSFFHLVAAEKSRPVTKKFIEKIGYFDPHADGGKGELVFDAESIKKHIANGAQISESVARKLVKAGVKEAGKFVKQRHTVAPKPKEEPKPVEVAVEAPAESEAAETAAEPKAEEAEKTVE